MNQFFVRKQKGGKKSGNLIIFLKTLFSGNEYNPESKIRTLQFAIHRQDGLTRNCVSVCYPLDYASIWFTTKVPFAEVLKIKEWKFLKLAIE